MAKGGIPVVLVDNGAPAVITNRGMPITIVGGDGGGLVQDGDGITLSNADDTGNLATVTANIVDGALANVALPANKAVLTDQQASVNINQYDDSGSFAANVTVATNTPTFKLANATTRIVVDALPITVVAGGGKTAPATIEVDQGVLGNFPLTNATDALISNAQLVTITNSNNLLASTGSAVVGGGSVTRVSLPSQVTPVSNGQVLTGLPPTGTYTNQITFAVANGIITGITLS